LEEAEKNIKKLSNVIEVLKKLDQLKDTTETEESKKLMKAAEDAERIFHEAMDDDFNTGLGTGTMFDLAKAINVYDQAVQNGTPADHNAIAKALSVFKTILHVFGLLEAQWDAKESASNDDFDKIMKILLNVREEARKNKMYKIADEIRDKCNECGIEIKDTPTGARWNKRGL
jgi:cysteinyl-tRNA synthetase